MKTANKSKKRLNRISYFINMLITIPVLSLGIAVGRSQAHYDEDRGLIFIAQLISTVLAVIVVIWTVRRLHDIGKSGWWSLLLLPPFTIFLWGYLFIFNYDKDTGNKWGEHSEKLRLFGIEAKNVWRLLAIMLIVLSMTFFGFFFYSLYSSL